MQRSTYQPSPQTRQARLQQLTTQLLWRLQQSSPFHSSSNAELVLPVLPEATPRLGVPDRPARLLPGLEESQGALYEIGVADDGTLVGLVTDELEESLNNLRAMASSLGCIVEILRKVVVGSCEWIDPEDQAEDQKHHRDVLSVAEVLVRPDTTAKEIAGPPIVNTLASLDLGIGEQQLQQPARAVEQLRIAFAGPSTAGKSSLLGTLTTSILDNGRGKSRLSLLKHRHEIASGVTSSVAHELVGYRGRGIQEDFVVNYASGDVSTWTDIHGLSDRLCFMTDSPGHVRYAKSTFRALISWRPDWTLLCVSADEGSEQSGTNPSPSPTESAQSGSLSTSDASLAHIEVSLRLKLPLVVVVTKMDVATKTRLRLVLAKILSVLKNAGRRPLLLSSASSPIPSFALDSSEALPDLQKVRMEELIEVNNVVNAVAISGAAQVVPIVMTSAVGGSSIGKLHALLSRLPQTAGSCSPPSNLRATNDRPLFFIDEVFSIPPVRIYSSSHETPSSQDEGVVLCGRLGRHQVRVGEVLWLGPFSADRAPCRSADVRAKSFSAPENRRSSTSLAAHLAASLQIHTNRSGPTGSVRFLPVKVVSLRNLRLPVLQMKAGETGTIGVEPTVPSTDSTTLQKARKGMVLIAGPVTPIACRSLVATFPARDFLVPSPPLILGGHAMAYIHSIRTAVKVVALAIAEDETHDRSSPSEVFAFDAESEEPDDFTGREVQITFRFVKSVEYIEISDNILVVPTLASTPGSQVVQSALAGFAGTVTGVFA
jgi:GTPase